MEGPLHATDDATRPAALLLGRIFPIFSLVAPGRAGASSASVRRAPSITGS
jgi:hypothetical protein